MPLIELPDTELVVDIPDIVVNGITFKRKAHSHTVQIEDIDKRVVLHILVYYYGTDNMPIDNESIGIKPYLRTLTADNNYLVDATNGMPLCALSEQFVKGEDDADVENPVLAGKTYVREFQLFAQMQTQPVVINDMKRNKIVYAASVGKLD